VGESLVYQKIEASQNMFDYTIDIHSYRCSWCRNHLCKRDWLRSTTNFSSSWLCSWYGHLFRHGFWRLSSLERREVRLFLLLLQGYILWWFIRINYWFKLRIPWWLTTLWELVLWLSSIKYTRVCRTSTDNIYYVYSTNHYLCDGLIWKTSK